MREDVRATEPGELLYEVEDFRTVPENTWCRLEPHSIRPQPLALAFRRSGVGWARGWTHLISCTHRRLREILELLQKRIAFPLDVLRQFGLKSMSWRS